MKLQSNPVDYRSWKQQFQIHLQAARTVYSIEASCSNLNTNKQPLARDNCSLHTWSSKPGKQHAAFHPALRNLHCDAGNDHLIWHVDASGFFSVFCAHHLCPQDIVAVWGVEAITEFVQQEYEKKRRMRNLLIFARHYDLLQVIVSSSQKKCKICAFRKGLKKITETRSKTGSSEDDVYKPSLWYYHQLLLWCGGRFSWSSNQCWKNRGFCQLVTTVTAAYQQRHTNIWLSHKCHHKYRGNW